MLLISRLLFLPDENNNENEMTFHNIVHLLIVHTRLTEFQSV